MKKHQGLRPVIMSALALAAACAFTLGLESALALGRQSASAHGAAAPLGAVGDWQGTLDTGNGVLHIVVHVTQAPDGSLTGTMDSPDQQASGIPITTITYKDPALHFEAASIKGSFDGTMSKDGPSIEGQWKQGEAMLALTLKRATKAT